MAIRPKPAFRALFEVATTREGSGVGLINETPPDPDGPEASLPCFWWRRGRVELHLKHSLALLIAVKWTKFLAPVHLLHRANA